MLWNPEIPPAAPGLPTTKQRNMSNQTTDRNQSGGNRGDRGRRNRGGRNRQGRNRGDQGNRDRQDQRQGQGNRSEFRPPRQEAKAKPLTWWQRLLSAIGLWKAPAKPAQRPPQDSQAPTRERRDLREPRESREPREQREQRERAEAPRSNTRVARTPNADGATPLAPGVVDSPRLYVGNLSYEATESDLEELLKGFGSVRSVEIVYNRRTHVSKGYAFVEMHHLDDAKRAVEVLHDQPFMGRKLTVNSAKSRGPADESDDEPVNERNDQRNEQRAERAPERTERPERAPEQAAPAPAPAPAHAEASEPAPATDEAEHDHDHA